MKNVCKFYKRCLEKLESGDFVDGVAKKSFVLLMVVVKHMLYKSGRPYSSGWLT